MNEEQFNRLLSWSILSALNSGQLLLRSQLGRDLEQTEVEKCCKDAYAHAELIYGELVGKRK